MVPLKMVNFMAKAKLEGRMSFGGDIAVQIRNAFAVKGQQQLRLNMFIGQMFGKATLDSFEKTSADPALLTLEGQGLIRARVFPIQPGETRKVVLR